MADPTPVTSVREREDQDQDDRAVRVRHIQQALDATYSRDPLDPSIAVVDGYGIDVRIDRGHLALSDGVGSHRRKRRYPRAQRTLKRLVIIGQSGSVSLDAIRWCADTGVSLSHVDPSGRVLFSTGIHRDSKDESKLRRMQALAGGTEVGAAIARELLTGKHAGQSGNLRTIFGLAALPDSLTVGHLQTAGTVEDLIGCEAKASADYFLQWSGVRIKFPHRDVGRIPDHWQTFTNRRPIHGRANSPINAADPINALLNYCYALAEVECRLAAIIMGLDPGIGFFHYDVRNRSSLALDLIEPIRPAVDAHILSLLSEHIFSRVDFVESRDGTCRILPPLTHQLASTMKMWARLVAPYAERVAHTLIESSPHQMRRRTPLTRTSKLASAYARGEGKPQSAGRIVRILNRCETCGTELHTGKRMCGPCDKQDNLKRFGERRARGQASMARLRASGNDPTQTPEARAQRARSLAEERERRNKWDSENPAAVRDVKVYERDVLPYLPAFSVGAIGKATGLSRSMSALIRRGERTPHPMYWTALEILIRETEPTDL